MSVAIALLYILQMHIVRESKRQTTMRSREKKHTQNIDDFFYLTGILIAFHSNLLYIRFGNETIYELIVWRLSMNCIVIALLIRITIVYILFSRIQLNANFITKSFLT